MELFFNYQIAKNTKYFIVPKNQAKATAQVIAKFLKTKLQLTINTDKSGIRRPVNFTLLGLRFVPTYKRGIKNKYQLVVTEKTWKKLKERLKSISRKTAPVKIEERIAKIKEVQRGWLNYFRGTSQQAEGERKRKNLIRLGVDQDHAYAWSRTRKGGWAIAQSLILITIITLKRLKQRGYQSLTEVYIELNPSLCEPPNT